MVEYTSTQPANPIYSQNDEVDADDLACATCLAVVDVVDKHLSKKSFDGFEVRLNDLLENICEADNFRVYDFIPPKMTEACRKFMDKNDEEELVVLFAKFYLSSTNHNHRYLLERKLCLGLSGECVGNKRMEKKKEAGDKSKKTPKNDEEKQFNAGLDDLVKKHGGKIKELHPVKHKDEL